MASLELAHKCTCAEPGQARPVMNLVNNKVVNIDEPVRIIQVHSAAALYQTNKQTNKNLTKPALVKCWTFGCFAKIGKVGRDESVCVSKMSCEELDGF